MLKKSRPNSFYYCVPIPDMTIKIVCRNRLQLQCVNRMYVNKILVVSLNINTLKLITVYLVSFHTYTWQFVCTILNFYYNDNPFKTIKLNHTIFTYEYG